MQSNITLDPNMIDSLRVALKKEIDKIDENYLEPLYKMISALRPVEPSLDIEVITPNDPDYKIILEGREHRKKHPEDYGTMSDINWS
ncbi:MAG: hypothetical protein GXO60_07160 [Epsilonproteobacteria bacterium]|nr:hypothetical protein [Campylobacterota bacterium]